MVNRRRRYAAAAATCALLLAGGRALATEVEGFSLSDAKPTEHREYGPIVAQQGALAGSLSNCRQLPSSALIPVEFNFKKTNHVAEFTVSWDSPQTNDLDIYLHSEFGEQLGSSSSPSHPESLAVSGLENATYYLCVVNFSGPNSGFVVDAKVNYVKRYVPPPAPETPTPRTPAPTPLPTPEPTAASTPAPDNIDAVKTPGLDGPDGEQDLLAVGSGKQAEPSSGRSGVQVVFLILTVLIAAGGATFVILRIRRDTA